MKVVFHVNIFFEAGRRGNPYAFCKKEFDLEMQPQLGIPVEHPVWHEPRPIKNISFNLEDKSFYVLLIPEKPDDQQECNSLVEMYKSHGWTVNPDYPGPDFSGGST